MIEVTLERSGTQRTGSYGVEHCEGSAFDRVPDDDSLKITIIEVPIVGGRGNSWGGGR